MMAAITRFDAVLDAVEIDLLCTYAAVAPPFPLRVKASGTTDSERLASFRAARERLAGRGLADDRGPHGVAELFVHLLRTCTTTLDLMLAVGTDRLGAAVLTHRGEALLMISDLGDPDRTARFVAMPPDDAVDELLLLIPELDAPMTTPLNLPRRAVDNVYRTLLDRAAAQPDAAPISAHELDELLRSHGIDERLANRMVTQLQPVLGNGQAGLAERGGYANDWRRVGEELRWLDTERGRFKLAGTSEWTSVNPLFANELASSVRRLAAAVIP